MHLSADSIEPARRGALTAVLAALGLAVHLTVQRLAPPPVVRAGDGLVGLVPFLPWTVWIYLLFFPLLVLAGMLVEARRWTRLVLAWAAASAVTWALVLLVPVTFPRADPAALGTLHGWIFGLVYGIDAAHVTFPCLHSAVIWIAWLALSDRGRPLRAAGFVLAVAITLSTMTTRQHLVTDNLAGLAIAWACARVALPAGEAGARRRRPGASPHERAEPPAS